MSILNIPWRASSESLFRSYRRMASFSSVWEDIVQGSPVSENGLAFIKQDLIAIQINILKTHQIFLKHWTSTFFPLKLTNLPHQATWPWKAVDHQIYKCPLSQSRNLHRIFLDLCLLWVCPYKHHHEFVYNLYWKINSYLHKYLHIFVHFFKPFKIIQGTLQLLHLHYL